MHGLAAYVSFGINSWAYQSVEEQVFVFGFQLGVLFGMKIPLFLGLVMNDDADNCCGYIYLIVFLQRKKENSQDLSYFQSARVEQPSYNWTYTVLFISS